MERGREREIFTRLMGGLRLMRRSLRGNGTARGVIIYSEKVERGNFIIFAIRIYIHAYTHIILNEESN